MRTIFPVPLILIILLMSSFPLRAGESDRNIVLETSVSNSTPYSGEKIELSYWLLFSGTAPKIIDLDQPVHPGMWAENSTEKRMMPSTPVTIEGKQYRRAVIKTMRLIPLQTGRLSITGYKLLCTIPETIVIGDDPVAHDSLIIDAPAAEIDVRPLPVPVPASFSGAVGSVGVQRTSSRDSLHEGETALITTIVRANGNIQAMDEPSVRYPGSLELLRSETTRGDSMTIRQTVMAKKTGGVSLPAVDITYFDPERESYATASSLPLFITILPAADTANASPVMESGEATQDRLLILPALTGGTVLALLAILIAIAVRMKPRHIRLTNAPASTKRHSPEAAATAGDGSATTVIRNRLYDTLETVLTLHPRGMTRKRLSEAMLQQGIEEETRHEILSLLDELDMADFSPVGKETHEIGKMQKRAEQLTRQLRRSRPSR